MDGEQLLPAGYFRVPRLRAVRKVLVELLVSRSARILATVRCRTVVETTASMASHGRSVER
ncbi:hypothetical protein ACFQ1S_00105 [Kibdelosporangium lantanae]|uniref:Uncharacterized protein n=1 Tax=Kibdelosporangium lantanae TaxID=1497396 RepID=A0ABW3M0M7_9PSEU